MKKKKVAGKTIITIHLDGIGLVDCLLTTTQQKKLNKQLLPYPSVPHQTLTK